MILRPAKTFLSHLIGPEQVEHMPNRRIIVGLFTWNIIITHKVNADMIHWQSYLFVSILRELTVGVLAKFFNSLWIDLNSSKLSLYLIEAILMDTFVCYGASLKRIDPNSCVHFFSKHARTSASRQNFYNVLFGRAAGRRKFSMSMHCSMQFSWLVVRALSSSNSLAWQAIRWRHWQWNTCYLQQLRVTVGWCSCTCHSAWCWPTRQSFWSSH